MSALRVLIADDEQMARKRLRRLLEAMAGVEIVSECSSGDAALSALETLDVDVAVLDVQMPGLSGLDVSTAAAELGVEVVLATAHSEHALRAFEAGVVDYVVKPVEESRLVQALERARARVEARLEVRGSEAHPRHAQVERLALSSHGEVRLIDPEHVAYAMLGEALVEVGVVVGVTLERLETELTLAELEKRLAGSGLLRVHRRALLSLAHVDRLRPLPSGGYLAITRAGAEVPVSRQAARRLRERLGIA